MMQIQPLINKIYSQVVKLEKCSVAEFVIISSCRCWIFNWIAVDLSPTQPPVASNQSFG